MSAAAAVAAGELGQECGVNLGRHHRAEWPAISSTLRISCLLPLAALMEVARMRNVLLIAGGLFGGMWVFQIYTAFLPEFFRSYRGMSLAEASLMTQVLPFTGLFAALGGGIGTGMSGLRKPFTWPIAFATLLGCAGALTFPDPTWIRLSLVLVGIGSAGSLAAITTLLMELPGMNPTRVGAALGFVWAIGYFGAFISPFLGGALAAHIGLRTVMLGFLVFQFLPIVTMYFLPETAPAAPATKSRLPRSRPKFPRSEQRPNNLVPLPARVFGLGTWVTERAGT